MNQNCSLLRNTNKIRISTKGQKNNSLCIGQARNKDENNKLKVFVIREEI